MRPGRLRSTELSHARLVLAPGSARRGQIACTALVVLAFAAGAWAGRAYWAQTPAPPVADMAAVQGLQEGLAQALLKVRVADARSVELERQVDTLNQRLQACQEEVTFFRKAVNGKR